MPITDCPIIGYYNRQRFVQYDPSDCANFYLVPDDLGKKKVALYPTMGRQHINYLGQNRLIFSVEPRELYKSVNYWYAIVADSIFRTDRFYNMVEITSGVKLNTINGDIYSTFIAINPSTAGSTTGITFVCFADGQSFYLYNETTGEFGIVTDPHLPHNPIYLATFGNRIVVSTLDSATFGLSEINLNYNASFMTMLGNCFTIDSKAIFTQETGIIHQMGVLQNTLYIFCEYTTGIWSNIPSTFISIAGTVTSFPLKKNTTYDWDFGIADPTTLDIDFGMMTWLARNRSGLIEVVNCVGGQKPQSISTKAIDVLLQSIVNVDNLSPISTLNADGFLYDYENTIFYRFSGGVYDDTQLLDQKNTSFSVEYNFDTQTWHRCIELNGQRNRCQDHIFFNNQHFVTVEGDNTVYELSGQFYTNEITNPDQPDPQMPDSYIKDPFRYERVTPIICYGLIDVLASKDATFYAEFITDWIEIDFVWGEETFINSTAPFDNAVYIVDEEKSGGEDVFLVDETDSNTFLIGEEGNLPVIDSNHYHTWFKPHVELYYSDDGGISFKPADVLEIAQLGVFQWRMRWYQLGTSRNRVYKLICVSPSPIVILGANMSVRRASGGAS